MKYDTKVLKIPTIKVLTKIGHLTTHSPIECSSIAIYIKKAQGLKNVLVITDIFTK